MVHEVVMRSILFVRGLTMAGRLYRMEKSTGGRSMSVKPFPKWKGDLFAGALVLTHLNRIQLDASGKELKEERLLEELGERIRSIEESEQGWLYLSTDSGKIIRIVPSD